jgi:hypothetical protein
MPRRKVALLGYALEGFSRGFDAIQEIAAFWGQQAHDLVFPWRGWHSRTDRIEIDQLAQFEFVVRHLTSRLPALNYRPFLPLPVLRWAAHAGCAVAIFAVLTFGFLCSRLLLCSRIATVFVSLTGWALNERLALTCRVASPWLAADDAMPAMGVRPCPSPCVRTLLSIAQGVPIILLANFAAPMSVGCSATHSGTRQRAFAEVTFDQTTVASRDRIAMP